ncbi:heme-binding protein [Mycolicibacterium vaccae]|uniref:heme-binding protein n=1 Tax=Mycolicibacterium vaccae TaxID=1810 RepID=UPI003D01696D
MLSDKSFARRIVVAGLASGAVLLGAAVTVSAQPPSPTPAPPSPAPAPAPPPPNCTAADLAGVMSQVTAATQAYLYAHPPVNDFFTSLKDVPKEEKKAALENYLNANPQTQTDLRNIRQPAADFRNRCG